MQVDIYQYCVTYHDNIMPGINMKEIATKILMKVYKGKLNYVKQTYINKSKVGYDPFF